MRFLRAIKDFFVVIGHAISALLFPKRYTATEESTNSVDNSVRQDSYMTNIKKAQTEVINNMFDVAVADGSPKTVVHNASLTLKQKNTANPEIIKHRTKMFLQRAARAEQQILDEITSGANQDYVKFNF